MIKKIKEYDHEKIIYIVFSLFIFTSAIALTSWSTIYSDSVVNHILKVIRYFTYFLCAICILFKLAKKTYSKQSFIFFCIMMIVSALDIVTSGERTVFLFVVLLATVYGCDRKKILKLSCAIQGGVLFLTIFCALLGFIQNIVVDEERMRYSLGFAWASYASNLFLFVVMQYLIIRRNKIMWFELMIMEFINVFIFFQTDTKMSFLIVTIILCIMLVMKIGVVEKFFLNLKKHLFSLKRQYFIRIPWICALLAVFIPLYKNESTLWKIINTGLSGRLEYGKKGIINYGFSICGQKIDMQGFSVLGQNDKIYNYIDSSYLQIAIRYGILMLFLVCIIYSFALVKIKNENDALAFMIFMVILLLCIVEPFLFDVAFNIFPILIVCNDLTSKASL